MWDAQIVTVPCSWGSCTRERTHLPFLMAYCAPSISGNSFDVMLSVWRDPSMDSSMRPSQSEISNMMFSKKDPAKQLSGTCQIIHTETPKVPQN